MSNQYKKKNGQKSNMYSKFNNEQQHGYVDTSNNKVLLRFYEYLFGDLDNKKLKHLAVYLLTISILELLSYMFHRIFSIISSRLWLFGGLICLMSIITYFIKSLIVDIKKMEYLSFISIIVLIISLFVFIGNINISEINPDATQQAAAGMDSFSKTDLNYTGKAFLGYPNRQYILTALPAILFGRSIATLHLGFALPFILGTLLLYSALRNWTQRLGINTNLAVLPLFALFVFPYVTEYYANFEQAIYPISFTMIAIGFYLNILCNPNIISIIGFAWIGCLLGTSYTPALAVLGLMVVFTAISSYLWLKKPSLMPFSINMPGLAGKAFMLVDLNVIVFFIATLIDKREDKLTQIRSNIDIPKFSYNSIIDFLTDKNARFLGMFGIIVIIYLFAGLTYQLKVRDILLSLWILGVFVASSLMVGYTSYEPYWIMQRALIIIPVVLVGLMLSFFDIIYKYKIEIKHGIIAILIISFSFIGFYNFKQINQSIIYLNYVQPMKYLFSDLEKTIISDQTDRNGEFNLILYTDSALLKNPEDYCKFLFPNAHIYIPESGQFPEDIDINLNTYVYGESEFPEWLLIRKYDLLTFNDTKYDLIVSWYKGEIIR